MRTIHKRKRSHGIPFAARLKRRRIVRRRRFGRRRTFGYTSKALRPVRAFAYRARKLGKRSWRKVLWRDTIAGVHYRSIFSGSPSTTVGTPNNTTALNWDVYDAFICDVPANRFWKSAGGLLDPSYGVTPVWAQAPGAGVFDPIGLIIRGGTIWMHIVNPGSDTLQMRIQLVFVKSEKRNASDSAAATTRATWLSDMGAFGGAAPVSRPIGWDLQAMPDYSQYFYKPIIDRTWNIPQSEMFQVEYKLKPQKLDLTIFNRGAGWFPVWIVYAHQMVDNIAGASTPFIRMGHNISFANVDLPQ